MAKAPDPNEVGRTLSALLQAGRGQEALALCASAVAAAKGQDRGRMLELQAQIQLQCGRPDQAEASLSRAAGLGLSAMGMALLADIRIRSGRVADGIKTMARAAAMPGAPPALWHSLGTAQWQAGAQAEAAASFRAAVKADPNLAAAWNDLGRACAARGEYDEARHAFAKVVALAPNNVDALTALARLLLRAGSGDAVAVVERALALSERPLLVELLIEALLVAGRFDDALARLERAPPSLENTLRRAQVYRETARWDEAEALYLGLLDQVPAADKGRLWENLATLECARARLLPAVSYFDQAIALAPDDSALRMKRGMALLSLGRLEEGWPDFEHRFTAGLAQGGILPQPLPQPPWQGKDLAGKTILIWGEQGIGDDLLQSTALAELVARAGKVMIHTDARLLPALRRSLPAGVEFFPRTDTFPPQMLSAAVDYQCSMGSMLRWLRPSLDSFPRPLQPVLRPDPQLVEALRQRYRSLPGLKVGLSWRSKNLVNGRYKSCALGLWKHLLEVPGLSFVSLQYGDTKAEIEAIRRDLGVEVWQDPQVDQMKDMEIFLAQVACMDVVVSVSNVAAHAAGVLGVPLMVLLSAAPLWVWFTDSADSPWYPQARLFRQKDLGRWEDVVESARDHLAAMAAARQA